MRERNGVRIGARVKDLDGKDLGRVANLYEWAFSVVKGFPILFRREHVIRYDEVRGERDGAVVISRSDDALFQLAAGEMPAVWRIPAPPDFPQSATPAEARAVFAGLASAPPQPRAGQGAPTAHVVTPAPRTQATRDEADYERTRGQSVPGSASTHT